MNARRTSLMALLLVTMGGLAHAGVNKEIEEEYAGLLKGRTVVPKVDVKVIKIKKQVWGDQARGFAGTDSLEQLKDATIVTAAGVSYADEAHAHEVLFAPKGSALIVEDVDFGRSSIEIKVRADGSSSSTVITFDFDKKLDATFSDRATFDQMLGSTFEILPTEVAHS
ncbi:MAG: hypothetical protein U0166_09860 [Acidobacteriota bacterium]